MDYVRELRTLVGHRPLLLPIAAVLIFDEAGQVLLQRRADNGRWGVPGGAMEPGESFEDAARREAREETGLIVARLILVDVFSGPDFSSSIRTATKRFSWVAHLSPARFRGI
jgi:8-oxo-dGTP pyrophosphatase MutT (NUDIX family)